MADIELVIKLSEDSYKATCRGLMLPQDVENVVNAIKNGKTLPKGHGRLIDADKLEFEKCTLETDSSISFYMIDKEDVDHAPTIIEAENEG